MDFLSHVGLIRTAPPAQLDHPSAETTALEWGTYTNWGTSPHHLQRALDDDSELSVMPPPPLPTPPPTPTAPPPRAPYLPAPPSVWKVEGGQGSSSAPCRVLNGRCVTGFHEDSTHMPGGNCTATALKDVLVSALWYSVVTQTRDEPNGDYLTINGIEYHNASAPPENVFMGAGESLLWRTRNGVRQGFELCATLAPARSAPSPPPPPLSPPLPTLPRSPMPPPPPCPNPPEPSPPPAPVVPPPLPTDVPLPSPPKLSPPTSLNGTDAHLTAPGEQGTAVMAVAIGCGGAVLLAVLAFWKCCRTRTVSRAMLYNHAIDREWGAAMYAPPQDPLMPAHRLTRFVGNSCVGWEDGWRPWVPVVFEPLHVRSPIACLIQTLTL